VATAPHCLECQSSIWFFEYFNAWVTADRTGWLYIWDLEAERPKRKIKLVAESQVNDLVVIASVGLVAVVQERRISVEGKRVLARRRKEEREEEPGAGRKDGEHEGPVIYLYDYLKGEVATKIELGS
jgi:hypothetical protein